MTRDTPTRTVIITGGNRGLGYECARNVLSANRDWQVILASRNQQRATDAASALSTETRNGNISTLELDLASLNSVRRFAEAVHNRLDTDTLPPLEALVCNAGIQQTTGTTYTEDGFEPTFGVNHLGHFLLVNLLLDRIQSSGRVVFVSSGAHDPTGFWTRTVGMPAPELTDVQALAFPDENPETNPRNLGQERYTTSKLAVLLTAYELDRRLRALNTGVPSPRITSNAFDPGLMPGTGLARDRGSAVRFLWDHVMPLLQMFPGVNSPKTSGSNLAWLVTEPALKTISGEYFVERETAGSSLESHDEELARRLWVESAKLVGLGGDVTGTSEDATISALNPGLS